MIDETKIKQGVSLLLNGLGCDKADRNFKDTPERYLKFLKEMFQKETNFTVFPEEHDQMIIMRGHECWTLCPHHLLPVKITLHVAYIPNGQVLGLSKLARIFDVVNTKPMMQETITEEIANRLFADTGCLGCGVITEGEHLCMHMRGVRSRSKAIMSAVRGVLANNPMARQEFLSLAVRP